MTNLLLKLPLIVILMGIAAASMLVPALHATILRDYAVARGFLYSGLIVAVLVAMIAIATLNFRSRNVARGHMVALAAAYLVLPILLALPLTQLRLGIGFAEAWFEMLSCFTTTGATLFDPSRLPPSVHLWRAFVGWMGGFFILLMALAVLAPMNLGGVEVVSGRTPGRGAVGTAQISRIAEPSVRILRFAAQLFPVYGALTMTLWIALMLAGDSSLVALCHAMSTLSTSGISPLNGVQDSASGVVGEVLIFAFLIVALSRRFMPGASVAAQGQRRRDDPELRLGLAFVAIVPLIFFGYHWVGAAPANVTQPFTALWGGAFLALSFLTTTGFDSHSAQVAVDWAGLRSPGLVLMGLAIVGGGVATTAGGVKLLRVYALLRHGEREIAKLVHPHAAGGDGGARRQVGRDGAFLAWVFFMLFALSIAVFTALLTLTGQSFDTSLLLAIACLTTTGPLAANLPDIAISYADLHRFDHAVLGLAMVVGRLETLALLALLAPDSWRR